MRASVLCMTLACAVALTACGSGESTPAADTTAAGGAATTPPPVATTDDDLDDRVEDALDADTALRAFDLDAEEEDGGLKLEGRVRTAEQKTLAEQVARRIATSGAIENRIEVDANARMREGDPDDTDDRVEDALKADAALAGLDLDADDRSGGIVLKGTVRTAEQKAAAEAAAKRVAPNARIDNQLRVQ